MPPAEVPYCTAAIRTLPVFKNVAPVASRVNGDRDYTVPRRVSEGKKAAFFWRQMRPERDPGPLGAYVESPVVFVM